MPRRSIADDCYHDWPLILITIGGHEPQWADDVITTVREFDEDARILIMGWMIDMARIGLILTRN